MNITDIITGGFIGSVITLAIKTIIDWLSASTAYKRELRKQVFQRRTEIAGRAISWYQEVFDMYSIFQTAINEYAKSESDNPVTIEKILYSSTRLHGLLEEMSTRLNPVLLYYDFSEIGEKYHTAEADKLINDAFVLVGKIQKYLSSPVTNLTEINNRQAWFNHLQETLLIAASGISSPKAAILEIQQRLRTDYQAILKG